MTRLKRIAHARLAVGAVTAASMFAVAAALPAGSNAEPSLSQLHSSLDAAQVQAQSLSANVAHLSGMINSLGSQIAFVRQREATVRAQLASEQATLQRTTVALARERRVLRRLIARLHRAQSILGNQLVSSYERDNPDLLTVMLDSNGFSQLINQLTYMRRAEQEQKTEIRITRQTRNQVHAATIRLGKLQATYKQMTLATAQREQALVGMNSLLNSRESALQQARAAQATALSAAQARGQALQSEIAHVRAQQAALARAQAQQAAAERAAQATPTLPKPPAPQASQTSSAPQPAPTPTGQEASGGWVIPGAIVACESGGQNMTPNSAGASGYYQIIPSTWQQYGGTGPAAYLASKAEQDRVASRIWAGAGWQAWDCARMLGIH
ncbi:MAG: transglycosylase family protein [Solirubrobacteraceae bacterium]